MSRRLYDISRPLSDSTPVWPGDQPFSLRWTMRQDRGATVNVGQVTSTLHLGTHVDAPLHFDSDAPGIDQLLTEVFVGTAQVVHVAGKSLIGVEDLKALAGGPAERLLLRTDSWSDPQCFPATIPCITTDLPAFLASKGIRLLGVDVPSVDQLDSHDLPNHRALAKHGIAILESLDLSSVPEGLYELIALPLRLVGADASPVRAILRDEK